MNYEAKDWVVIVSVFFVLWWAMNWWFALIAVIGVIIVQDGFIHTLGRIRSRRRRRRA